MQVTEGKMTNKYLEFGVNSLIIGDRCAIFLILPIEKIDSWDLKKKIPWLFLRQSSFKKELYANNHANLRAWNRVYQLMALGKIG